MPISTEYNLDYRPETYWGLNEQNSHIGSTVKGELRRQVAIDMAEDGHLDPVISIESLPPEHAQAAGGVHPWFLGGEYLPDLLPNEVEIARVVMKSVTLDVISIRARKTKHRIVYRIVDEYMEEGYFQYPLIQKTSKKPLTMKQLIRIIDNCQDDGGLMSCARNLNYSYSDSGPEEIFDFITISSEFYPDLNNWYDDANLEWLAGEQEKIESRMEMEYEDPTEELPEKSLHKDTEARKHCEIKEKIAEDTLTEREHDNFTTGKVIRQGKRVSIIEALPDDPIYKRGWIIGGMTFGSSSKNTQGSNINNVEAPKTNTDASEADWPEKKGRECT